MSLTDNQTRGLFFIVPVSILKEQISFLSQLIKKPIYYPPDQITYSFFAELYIYLLSENNLLNTEIINRYIDKLLVINNFKKDEFLIKQFFTLVTLNQLNMQFVIDVYIKKYLKDKPKEEITNEIKTKLKRYILEEF